MDGDDIFNYIEKNESKDLLNMLKEHIKSSYFISSGSDEESGNTFYTFDYNHNEKCINGKCHDRINGYVYISDMNIYAGCYSDKCKNQKKKIGTLNDVENWNLPNVVHFNTDFIPKDEEIMDQLKEFVNGDQQILALKSIMGSGKTQSVKSIVNDYFEKHNSNKRVLAFSLRQSYAKDVTNNAYKELNFMNYLKAKKTELKDHNRLIISLESLHKLFAKDIKMYDVIILDECELLLIHFFSMFAT